MKTPFHVIAWITPSGNTRAIVCTDASLQKRLARVHIEEGEVKDTQQFEDKDAAEVYRQEALNNLNRGSRRGL